ncbi:hypothetical protein D3C87_1563050 [compost metagenome]
MRIQERDILIQIGHLEGHLQNSVLTGQPLSLDKGQQIANLKKKIKELEAIGSSDLLIEYLQRRLESMEFNGTF